MTNKALIPPQQFDQHHGWVVIGAKGKASHVIPFGDMRPHECSLECWCRPVLDEEDDVIAHNSMDGREKIESGAKPQ